MLPGIVLNNNNHHYALPPQQQQINSGGNNSPYQLHRTKRISYMSRYDARQKQSFSANPEIVNRPIQSIQAHINQHQHNGTYAETTPYYPHTPLQTIHSNPHPTVTNNITYGQKEAAKTRQPPPPWTELCELFPSLH